MLRFVLAMTRYAGLCAMLLLTACGNNKPPDLLVTTQVVRDQIGKPLLECPDRPPPPERNSRVSRWMAYLRQVLEAHADCRGKVQAIARIVRGQPEAVMPPSTLTPPAPAARPATPR